MLLLLCCAIFASARQLNAGTLIIHLSVLLIHAHSDTMSLLLLSKLTLLVPACCLLLSTCSAEPVKASATATATASASGTNASAVASANATAHAEAGHNAGHDAGKPVTEASKGEPKKTETAAKPKEEPKTVPTNQGRLVCALVLVVFAGRGLELWPWVVYVKPAYLAVAATAVQQHPATRAGHSKSSFWVSRNAIAARLSSAG